MYPRKAIVEYEQEIAVLKKAVQNLEAQHDADTINLVDLQCQLQDAKVALTDSRKCLGRQAKTIKNLQKMRMLERGTIRELEEALKQTKFCLGDARKLVYSLDEARWQATKALRKAKTRTGRLAARLIELRMIVANQKDEIQVQWDANRDHQKQVETLKRCLQDKIRTLTSIRERWADVSMKKTKAERKVRCLTLEMARLELELDGKENTNAFIS